MTATDRSWLWSGKVQQMTNPDQRARFEREFGAGIANVIMDAVQAAEAPLLKDRETLLEDIDHYRQRIAELEAVIEDGGPTLDGYKCRIAELEQWVDDCQSDMYINCVYCGHRYGPNDGDHLNSMREALKAHISECPRHPLSAANQRIAELERDLSFSEEEAAAVRSEVRKISRQAESAAIERCAALLDRVKGSEYTAEEKQMARDFAAGFRALKPEGEHD